MDSAEKMAADIAVKLNGGEWKDGKWYSKGHREAWIKAVQPYADEIERLRKSLVSAKECIDGKAYTAAVMIIDTALQQKDSE